MAPEVTLQVFGAKKRHDNSTYEIHGNLALVRHDGEGLQVMILDRAFGSSTVGKGFKGTDLDAVTKAAKLALESYYDVAGPGA